MKVPVLWAAVALVVSVAGVTDRTRTLLANSFVGVSAAVLSEELELFDLFVSVAPV